MLGGLYKMPSRVGLDLAQKNVNENTFGITEKTVFVIIRNQMQQATPPPLLDRLSLTKSYLSTSDSIDKIILSSLITFIPIIEALVILPI